MCGFTGYILTNYSISDSATILNMLQLQQHRGPDDSGVVGINMASASIEEVSTQAPTIYTSSPNLIFGFNRLSILDLTPAGHQPMLHQESKVALMMNGEVYNAFDYKAELEEQGFRIKGHSDTEIVLYLYLAYGLEGMLQRLNGMFALAIYDGRQQSLYLIRDRMGIKPLYVLQNKTYFAFSSEMKSFKALPGFRFELDESKLSEFLLFRNAINHTLFKDIVNIKPGTYWKVGKEGQTEVHTYYNILDEGSRNEDFKKESLEATLRASVERQMISDVKLGCQLSGGVDSSLVTAYASETLKKGALETVSIIFDEASFSEKQYIDQVAQQYILNAHQFTLTPQAYLDLLDEAVWHFEQPINHPNTIGIKLLSREAKKHVTVLLSGEGADESLAGYGRFLPDSQNKWSLNTIKRAVKNRKHLGAFLKLIHNQDTRYIMGAAYGGVSTAKSLYTPFSATDAIQSRLTIWQSTATADSPLQRKRKYELLSYLPDLLMRQDKMSMAHSIENRVPFLDNQFIAAALSIPDELLVKQRNGRWEGKWLLKELCGEVFGADFAYRDKMGFGIPLKSFFSSDAFISRWENEILPGIQKRGLFNTVPLTKWMKSPQSMNAEQLDALWLMLGFEIWAQQYLD
jgi:asparagine synthase (glutamine-hydrolysing)